MSENEGISENVYLWKEMQGIIAHFNELIIKLRVQSLGGLAAITAILAVVTKSTEDLSLMYFIIALALIFFVMLWRALWILDTRYYSLLLLGAVDEMLAVEKAMATEQKYIPAFSTTIRHRVEGRSRDGNPLNHAEVTKRPAAINNFYKIVFVSLLAGTIGITILGWAALPRTSVAWEALNRIVTIF